MWNRLAAWLLTGPLGHLVGGLADWVALGARTLGRRARERAARAGRGRR